MLSDLFTTVSAKVAAASFAAVTTVGTGAAAATGNLPDQMQDGISQAAASVGIDLPDSGRVLDAAEVRQDAENRQDGDAPTVDRHDENLNGEGTDTDDAVLDTLGDGVSPTDDGSEFGSNVSDNASDGDLGDAVSGTASDGSDVSTDGDDAATAGSDNGAAGTEESSTADEYRPEDPPSDAPSDSGEQDTAEHDADSNPGDDHHN